MAHSSDYKHIYINSPDGLSIDEIKRCLGANTRSLGNLCKDLDKHGNAATLLTKWSGVKPVRSSALDSVNQADTIATMKAANYGFGGAEMFNNSDIAAVFDMAIANGCDWLYLKPRGKGGGTNGADEWYRKTDFNGYDRNSATAIPPIDVSGTVLTYNLDGGGVHRKLSFIFTIQSQAQIQLINLLDTSYDIYYPERTQWKYCALVRRLGDAGNPDVKFGNEYSVDVVTPGSEIMVPLFTYSNGIVSGYYHKPSEGPNAVISFQSPWSAGETYEIIPCVTKRWPGQPSGSGGAILYLPCGKIFYEVGQASLEPRVIMTAFHILGNQSSLSGDIRTGTGSASITFNTTLRIISTSQVYWDGDGFLLKARLYTKRNGQKIYGDFKTTNFCRYTPREPDGAGYPSISSGSVLTYTGIVDSSIPLPTDPDFVSGNGVYLELWLDNMPVSNSDLDSPVFVPI